MSKPKYYVNRSTRDYKLFDLVKHNRPMELSKHGILRESMRVNGFFPYCPLHVMRNKKGRFDILDGQHRFLFAQEFGLCVWFMEVDPSQPYDVAKLNRSVVKWDMMTFATTKAQEGKKDYADALAWAEAKGMPLGTAVHLLSGRTTYCGLKSAFEDGTWKITDIEFASQVAALYERIGRFGKFVKKRPFLDAACGCCRWPQFQMKRMLSAVEQCPDKLQPYATREKMLEMLEDIYNYKSQHKMPLKLEVEKVMKSRSASSVAVEKKERGKVGQMELPMQ